ncbi:hypothetical protein [Brevibacillus sp. SYSU BS000544]|uniref:hypothetical protein n=1 Tax=Brevibacillus sp. SYSU BS000544 TaxID=3416443 RepID=UPI003CE52B54
MRNLTFGIVSEGPTDFEMLSQLIQNILPGDHRFLPLQPDLSETEGFGAHGAGWKGVLSWCSSFDELNVLTYMSNVGIDVLIIHLDSDVSREPEINCAKSCPDADLTVIELEKKLSQLLNINQIPNNLIFCIPSDNTEAWILSAIDGENHHNPPFKYIECTHKPEYIIANKPYNLLKRKDGKPKKSQTVYRENLIPKVIESWESIKNSCFQAEKLNNRLLQIPR